MMAAAPTTHLCVVRADISLGQQFAQLLHAAGESAGGPLPEETIAVALHARDEAHLRAIAAQLAEAGIAHQLIIECDGQAQAIGCVPTTDRAALRRVTSMLPLMGKEARPRAA
jgi:hypothetical protein